MSLLDLAHQVYGHIVNELSPDYYVPGSKFCKEVFAT